MVLADGHGPIGDSGQVRELALDDLRPIDRQLWAQRLPDAPAEVPDQLADRRVLRRSCADEVVFLGVRDSRGAVVAHADLYLDHGFGCAQVEDVYTDPGHRGRGLARALLAEGAAGGGGGLPDHVPGRRRAGLAGALLRAARLHAGHAYPPVPAPARLSADRANATMSSRGRAAPRPRRPGTPPGPALP
ncbi:GNAT family N-acetyltransferase [Catellatospora bangladeshensis]|uniref:GNAT family N-acetyltransferase n=1 Tax=Catellatospora bangladeshensis TaxID=310355 RepID=UPI00360A2B9E